VLREIRQTPTGRRVVAKRAENPDEAARLRHEAQLLEAARHPGVVEVLSLDGDPVEPVLLTAHVDGSTLAAAGPLPVQEVAGVLAAVAATLADLHQLGIVHGSLSADHVILGRDGAPVLCGFGDGGRVGEQPVYGEEPFDGALDVFDLGALARSLCPPGSPEGRALRRLADDAGAAQPGERPTARALAASIPEAVAGARLPEARAADPPVPAQPGPVPAPDPLEAWRRQRPEAARIGPRHLTGVLGGAAAVLAMVLAASALRGGGGATAPAVLDRPADFTEPAPAVSSTTADRPAERAARPELPPGRAPRPDCPPVPPGLAADVDGDGCADPLRYAGGVLEAGEARWSVGRTGDLVATGDWSCTGALTLALLRPSTGEVFRFDRWAVSGADASAYPVARVTGATALRAADLDQDGCHEMVVEREGGTAEVLRSARDVP